MGDTSMDFLAELDLEVTQILAASNKKAKKEKLEKAVHNTRTPLARRQELTEELKLINAQLEAERWTITASIALFHRQHCDNCGSQHTIFLQHMQRLSMIRNPSSIKMERVPAPIPGTRKETVYHLSTTHICPDCVEEFDYPTHGAILASSPVTPSPHYHQDELYAQIEED